MKAIRKRLMKLENKFFKSQMFINRIRKICSGKPESEITDIVMKMSDEELQWMVGDDEEEETRETERIAALTDAEIEREINRLEALMMQWEPSERKRLAALSSEELEREKRQLQTLILLIYP